MCVQVPQTPSVVTVSLLLIDKPWFLNWGKTCCYTHHTFLLGSPNGRVICTYQALFLAPLPGIWDVPVKQTSSRINNTFSGTVAGELLGHITSTSTTSKKKLRTISKVFSGAIFKLGEDLALWVFSPSLDLHCNLLFLVLSLLYLDLPLVFLLSLAFNFQHCLYFLFIFSFVCLLSFSFQFLHSYIYQKHIKISVVFYFLQ